MYVLIWTLPTWLSYKSVIPGFPLKKSNAWIFFLIYYFLIITLGFKTFPGKSPVAVYLSRIEDLWVQKSLSKVQNKDMCLLTFSQRFALTARSFTLMISWTACTIGPQQLHISAIHRTLTINSPSKNLPEQLQMLGLDRFTGYLSHNWIDHYFVGVLSFGVC